MGFLSALYLFHGKLIKPGADPGWHILARWSFSTPRWKLFSHSCVERRPGGTYATKTFFDVSLTFSINTSQDESCSAGHVHCFEGACYNVWYVYEWTHRNFNDWFSYPIIAFYNQAYASNYSVWIKMQSKYTFNLQPLQTGDSAF